MELIGDVKGKNVILVDDDIDYWWHFEKPQRFNDGKDFSVEAICTCHILSGGRK
jgi:phosphoribosylpyrophosphate synthetase